MPRRVVKLLHADGDLLRKGIAGIQEELGVSPEFPAEVEAAAEEAARNPVMPELDRTDLPFVTIDPDGARDLDQALHIERDGDGYVVHYAIADVAAFVKPGDPVDVEANRRGETLYGADSKVPLHPPVLSEGAASLLPDEERPALLWTIKVDATGEGTDVDVVRARVRSQAQLDYASVQKQVDAGTADEMFGLLREVGELRIKREAARGGVSLPLPEQEIDIDGDRWSLKFREMLPVEQWNAQISLLTGMAAAHLMTTHGVGLLRTLPEPPSRAIGRLRRSARALGIEWPGSRSYPDFIRSLDPANPRHVAMLVSCTSVLRGAGYAAFEGDPPPQPMHSALASTYTHVTAPLRRLVDRYTGELCVAICAGEPVPQWVLDALPGLPRTMAVSSQRAGRYERAVIDLAEALVLAPRVGDTFEASIVDVDDRDANLGVAMLHALAIEAPVRAEGDGELPLGEVVRVQLERADPEQRAILFKRVA